ncbi:hypothetical protein BJX96DRAFT_145640 [Aspergillus floccosus]
MWKVLQLVSALCWWTLFVVFLFEDRLDQCPDAAFNVQACSECSCRVHRLTAAFSLASQLSVVGRRFRRISPCPVRGLAYIFCPTSDLIASISRCQTRYYAVTGIPADITVAIPDHFFLRYSFTSQLSDWDEVFIKSHMWRTGSSSPIEKKKIICRRCCYAPTCFSKRASDDLRNQDAWWARGMTRKISTRVRSQMESHLPGGLYANDGDQ